VNDVRYLQLLNECWNRLWMKFHWQYDIRFTLSKTERHIFSLARCEAGWIKFFLSDGLGAEDQSNGHQDPPTSCYLDFSLASSTVTHTILSHVPLTSKEYPFCYHMGHSPDFGMCVDSVCNIVSTFSKKRRDIKLNICCCSSCPEEISLMEHPL